MIFRKLQTKSQIRILEYILAINKLVTITQIVTLTTIVAPFLASWICEYYEWEHNLKSALWFLLKKLSK